MANNERNESACRREVKAIAREPDLVQRSCDAVQAGVDLKLERRQTGPHLGFGDRAAELNNGTWAVPALHPSSWMLACLGIIIILAVLMFCAGIDAFKRAGRKAVMMRTALGNLSQAGRWIERADESESLYGKRELVRQKP